MSSPDRSTENSISNATSSQLDDATTRRAEHELLQRLRKTQSEIRRVDLWTTFCALATVASGLLFLGVLCDHWILPDGFSTQGRLYFAIFWLVSSVAFFVVRLVPVLRRRVNSLYAAKVLEEVGQDKYNSTINWLQLRKSLAKGAPDVPTNEEARLALLKEVALQAVGKNRALPNETLVDCSPLVRWGVVFAVLVALCALYAILSPKSPFASFARIVAPFAKIERPQALRFESVTPGDATVFQGDVLEIVAEIPGAKEGDVEILFSTEDSRLVDVPLAMESEGVSKFRATAPGDNKGFEENLLYRVVVGRGGRFESVSETFHIEVRPQPSFRVEKTVFTFPTYTGLEPQTFDAQGDVRALEGTQIEILARSNYPLENAYFLPDAAETRAVKMTRSSDSPESASTSFTLEWKESDSPDAEKVQAFSFYRLLSQSVDGEKNRDAQNYNVSIVADLPPTINWEDENEEIAEIPLNDALRVKFQAEDPDFSLRRVEMHVAFHDTENDAQVASRAKIEPIALPFPASKTRANEKYETGPTPFVGVQTLSCALKPEELGLEVGDEIEYWGVAIDSKEPEPNVASTEKRLFVVVEPVDNPQNLNDEGDEQGENQGESQNSEQSQGGEGSGEGEGSGDSKSQNDAGSSENGNNDSQSGNQNSDKEKEGAQGESNSDQGESEGEEGAESNDAGASEKGEQNGANGQGEESGDQGAGNSQEEGASGGSSSDPGASNKSQQSGAQSNESDEKGQGQSDESQGGEESKGENESGSKDSSNGPENSRSPSDADNSSDGSGGSSSPDDAPIDPETNPGDAFEKILDFAQKTEGISPNSNDAQAANSQGAQGDDEKEPTSSNDPNTDANEENEEGDSEGNGTNSSSEGKKSPEKEKRDLPGRKSREKPKEDSQRFQANNPEDVDPNTERRQGDVDPNSNDFLAQNADLGAEEDDSARDPNQNITLDPDDNSESVAADSVDKNANEAKGNSNAFNSDAPFEIDDEQKKKDDKSNAENDLTDDFDFPNPPTSGGGSGSNTEKESKVQAEANPSSDGFGGSENRKPNKEGKEGDSQGSGASDQNSERQGGGGGSGLGELGSGEQTLAPADAPQLQYAEKATNFVLNYLEDELKDEVDPRLLKELGWTEEQLREFLERWKQMRKEAKDGGKEAKERYLESLESVGLEDATVLGTDPQSVWEAKKKERNARAGANEAARLKTPERLDERVRAFTRGVAKGNR